MLELSCLKEQIMKKVDVRKIYIGEILKQTDVRKIQDNNIVFGDTTLIMYGITKTNLNLDCLQGLLEGTNIF